MRPWETLQRRYLLERPWMSLREDVVRVQSGAVIPEFHVVEYPDWACVLCFDEDGAVVLVEQYRHGVERVDLELPAGAIDAGEDPLEAARRELLEETGYAAEGWTLLGRCAPEPSKHTNYAYLYVAHGARKVTGQDLEVTEHMRVVRLAPEAVMQAAEEGGIIHGIHLTALFWAARKGWL